MKVKIGNYINPITTYTIGDLFKYIGFSEDRCFKIGNYLSKTKLKAILEFINSERKRKVYVRIDKHDVYSMDSTLALIILPMLKQLQIQKHGSPYVGDEDVPEFLKSTSCTPPKDPSDIDENHKRWDWILDELIWTFEQLQPGYDWLEQYTTGEIDFKFVDDGHGYSTLEHGPNHTYVRDEAKIQQHEKRIYNGLRLFGKYYQNLWD